MIENNLFNNIHQDLCKRKVKWSEVQHFDNILVRQQELSMQSTDSRNAQNSLEYATEDWSKNNYCKRIEILEMFIEKLGEQAKIDVSLIEYSRESNIREFHPLKLKIFTSIFKKTLLKSQISKYKKINWGKQELIILIWVIDKYCKINNTVPDELNENDWEFISSIVPAKNGQQCMFKWLSLNKNKFNEKFPWTLIEDELLKDLAISYESQKQKKWFEISKKLYLNNHGFKIYRTAKQCRERWACFLNPEVKKCLWTDSEDIILIENYLKIGKKWAIIAKLISGRTENAVKNRFNLILDKKKKKQYSNYYLSDQQFMRIHLQNLECEKMLQIQQKLSQKKHNKMTKKQKQNQNQSASTRSKVREQVTERQVDTTGCVIYQNEQQEKQNKKKSQATKKMKKNKKKLKETSIIQKINNDENDQNISYYQRQMASKEFFEFHLKDLKGTFNNSSNFNNCHSIQQSIEINNEVQQIFYQSSVQSLGNLLLGSTHSVNFLS